MYWLNGQELDKTRTDNKSYLLFPIEGTNWWSKSIILILKPNVKIQIQTKI